MISTFSIPSGMETSSILPRTILTTVGRKHQTSQWSKFCAMQKQIVSFFSPDSKYSLWSRLFSFTIFSAYSTILEQSTCKTRTSSIGMCCQKGEAWISWSTCQALSFYLHQWPSSHQLGLRTWRVSPFHSRHPAQLCLWTNACCGTWNFCMSMCALRLSAFPVMKMYAVDLWESKRPAIFSWEDSEYPSPSFFLWLSTKNQLCPGVFEHYKLQESGCL